MTNIFDSKVSLHSWLLWPMVWRDGELIECDSGATITSQPQRQEDLRLTCLQLRSSILQDDIFVQG